MKKLLFSVAILAVAASCSKNEVTDVAVSSQNAIGFATLNNLARSANDDDQQYKVYAAQDGVTDAWYIDDHSSSTSDAALINTYYWPADDSSLDFYAYAPYTAATASVTASTDITIAYTVPDTADEDFTIAEPITGLTSESTTYTATSAVPFKFSHQLSKADVTVVLHADLISAGYKLTMDEKVEYAAAEYSDGYTAETDPDGDYLVSAEVAAQDGATVTLSVFGTSATYNVMTQSVTYPETLPTTLTNYEKDYADNYFIFMPQSAVDCTISVSGVTITDPSDKVIAQSVTLGTYTITSDDLAIFNQNYYYAITLTIDENTITDDPKNIFGDAIAFSAETLSWDEKALGLGSANQASSEDEDEVVGGDTM